MTETQVRLTFPGRADYLLLGRLALAGLARVFPLEPEVLADLKLAVTEACGNAVRHAYAKGDGQVTVEFTVGDGRLEIVVGDQGDGFARPIADDWTMPDHLEGGMGMAIIREIVDELDVTEGTGGRGTRVRMTKSF